MATKYTSQFTSTRGAHYRVNIDDTTYGGTSPVEITMAPPGFTLTYDGSTSDRYTWVIGSSATLHYIAQNNNDLTLLDSIANSPEGRFRVTIEQNNGGSWEKRWTGVILAEQIETEDIDYPTPFQLTASDDLANLREVEYNAGGDTPYTGTATVAEHLANCLNKLRTATLLETTVVKIEEAWNSNQQSGTGYDRIYIRHAAFYAETEDLGTIEYFTAYDVLEQILSAFGLRLFQSNGQYIAQSISQAADAPTAVNYSNSDNAGNVTQSSETRPELSTTATDIERHRGWRNSYLNPLRKVTRAHRVGDGLFFAGTQYYTGTSTGSGDGTGILDGTVMAAPIDASDYLTTGDPLAVAFKVALVRKAVAFSGNAQVLPFRVRAVIRIGNQYLSRPVTFSGTYETPLISGGTVEVAAYTYGEATWTTNSAARVEFVTPPQQMTVDWTSVTSFGITAEGLPAGYSGDEIEWAFTADAIDTSGNVYANAVNAFNYATGHIQQVGVVRIYQAQTYLIDGEVATYEASNADSNGGRETLKLPEAKIGDNIGPNTVNYTTVLDATDSQTLTESWHRIGETEALELNALLCREILAGQTKTIRVQRGAFTDLTEGATALKYTLAHVLKHDGNDYLPFTLTLDAHADSYEGEWFQILTDRNDTTVPTSPGWTGEIIDPLEDQHAIQSLGEIATTQGGTIQDQQTKLQYITVTQAVNLDSVESQTNTNTGDISTLEAGLTATQNKIELIYKTFSPKGDDYGTTTVKYENDKTDGMQMALTATSTALQSGSGNTSLNLSENSPGIFEVTLQDENSPASSTTAVYAVGNSKGNLVGINNSSPAHPLDVTGSAQISGVLSVGGDTDVPNLDVAERIRFATDQQLTPNAGEITYDYDRTAFYIGAGGTAVDVFDDPWTVRNNTGATLAKGTPVYVTGTIGASGRKTVAKMLADGSIDSRYFLGVTAHDIANDSDGVVLDRGTIKGFNTSGLSGVLYVSDTTAGTWTTTAPTSPSQALAAAFVINAATNGTIAVRVAPDENATGSGGDLIDDTSPQLGGDLDTNGYNLDLSSNNASALIITGNQYAFRYRSTAGVLQNTGLYFNLGTGSYEFLNGSANCIFCIKAGSGTLSIGDMTAGTNFELPSARGTSGQILMTDNAGNVDWTTINAGTNLTVTTDPSAHTITLTPSATPTFTSILTTGTINAVGALTTLNNLSVGGTSSLSGAVSIQNSLTVSGDLIAQKLSFTGGSTSVIGIASGLPNQPDDLEIRSNGNVTVVLDYDSDEDAQAFIVKNQAGTVIFQVDEDGVTSGLLTTATPTTSGLPTSVQQGNPITGTVTNYDASKSYVAKIYDNSGTEQTANPVTVGAAGAISATAPATIGTGYELRIFAATPGQLKSPDDITTFAVTPSRTFTHWRFQPVDVNGNPTTTRVFLLDISIYTGANATGTGYPTTNATSNTSISGVTISAGYEQSSSYAAWKAFDSNLTSSGWWTISVPSTSAHWIQVEFSTAITAASVRIIEWQNFNHNPYVKVLGSNTGAFSGEEVDCGTFTTLSDSTYGSTAVTHILNI